MNSSLEPIPTKQAVVIETSPAMAGTQTASRTSMGRNVIKDVPAQEGSGLVKAYPWLLGTSVCLSAVLCWMYVTKPVIVPANSTSPSQAPIADSQPYPEPSEPTNVTSLMPSDTALPGTAPTVANGASSKTVSGQNGSPVSIDPRKLASMAGDTSAAGWESTNLKVQHILSADSGSGQLEKIILDVPVRYQTRTMRWTSMDVEKARNVLGRLMIYERDLNNLRKQGETILKDWNTLLEHTVPAPALRADSPSIPYNHGHGHERGGLPDSSTVIQVDNSAVDQQAVKKAQSQN